MTSEKIRWEEFNSKSQQYSPEKITRKESQKKKMSIKRKIKSKIRHGELTIPRP